MKKIVLLSIMILFFSCSSVEKNNYKILRSYLADINRVKTFEELCKSNKVNLPDTIFINKIIRSNRTIKRCFFFDESNNESIPSFWINCNEKMILNENDLGYIQSQISELDSNKTFNKNKLTFNNFKVSNNNSDSKSTTNKHLIYSFSEPIMSLDGSYSLFYFECYLENQYSLLSNYIIMKKNNGKWFFVGELCENKIID